MSRSTHTQLPVIGVTCCRKPGHEGRADLDEFTAGEKYLEAIHTYVGIPWPIAPTRGSMDPGQLAHQICQRLDGLLLTGSLSNVHPARYGDAESEHSKPYDPSRDVLVWALLDQATAMGLPILAICRGHQELNVYYGGSLHPRVHQAEGLMDHRADLKARQADDTSAMFGLNHRVAVTAGGRLEQVLGGKSSTMVNSLHLQGIDRLADNLLVEAVADDGLVEAASIRGYRGWSLAVQWHPEFDTAQHQDYASIFRAFGQAATEYGSQKCQK